MKFWTPTEDERLRELWPTERVAVIARTLGRTTNSVIGRAHRLGLSHRRDEINRRIREGYRAYMERVA